MNFYSALLIIMVIAASAFSFYVLSGRSKHQNKTTSGRQGIMTNAVEYRLSLGPRIVTIGGGTGLSTLLAGLKGFTRNITAVVAVTDEGGSSGRLRQEWGMLPPGDIRNCIVALAENDSSLNRLLNFRFDRGELK